MHLKELTICQQNEATFNMSKHLLKKDWIKVDLSIRSPLEEKDISTVTNNNKNRKLDGLTHYTVVMFHQILLQKLFILPVILKGS